MNIMKDTEFKAPFGCVGTSFPRQQDMWFGVQRRVVRSVFGVIRVEIRVKGWNPQEEDKGQIAKKMRRIRNGTNGGVLVSNTCKGF